MAQEQTIYLCQDCFKRSTLFPETPALRPIKVVAGTPDPGLIKWVTFNLNKEARTHVIVHGH